MTGPPARVLYITGWMRSGSTLLGNVLNELPGVLHIGELHFLWKNGVLGAGTNSTCGCGEPVTACPLWSRALAALPAGTTEETARRMLALQQQLMRTRHTRARLAEAQHRQPVPADVTRLLDQSAAVYRHLAGHGGERLVVDGSKCPAEAAALLGRDDLDVRVLHMVRDPRATALSYRGAKEYIDPMSASRSSRYWTAFNLASELVGRAAGDRYLRIRHEDLCARPRETVAEVIRFAGLDDASPVDAAGSVALGVNHTVTGNPDRLRHGVTRIRPDGRWHTALGPAEVRSATVPALPLLGRYGYPLTSAPHRPNSGLPHGTSGSSTPAPASAAPAPGTAAREEGRSGPLLRPLWPGEVW
ncbi:sulfotransferase [Streptomyces spiroverticillatus]|uniref:Sulfotransferase n=1 Tax=Streptomyces finlayi TaxID=67296 RepID=A0A919CDE9_9ACTN|nr:sulfotransferase [Streptomyces finlayi]GHA31891.1 sulfotransferase [Streptomyces spiroverticillatus]GHD10844.1 sulfotransferase [Streptomyces finlayi]